MLFVGRLSEEKGVRELAEAARGLSLVVVGDGPLRDLLPQATGFVAPELLGPVLRARVGRRRAVATRGLRHDRARGDGVRPPGGRDRGGRAADAVEDGVTGLLVPPGDVPRLRAALERLLGDRELRDRLGGCGRTRAHELFTGDAESRALVAAYTAAVG